MPKICGKWLNYLTIYVGNDICTFEMASVFEKRLQYVGNDVDLWKMAHICGEMA